MHFFRLLRLHLIYHHQLTLEHRHRYHLVVTNLLKFARFLWYLKLKHLLALLQTCDVTSIPHYLNFSIMLIRFFCTHYFYMFGFRCVVLFYLAYWKINFYFTPAKLYCQRLQSIQYSYLAAVDVDTFGIFYLNLCHLLVVIIS